MVEKNVIAIDLGASSGRLISGTYFSDKKKIELNEQFRFSNQPIHLTRSFYWDYLKIFQEIKYGLSMSEKNLDNISSISVDTWGVDYGLIDGNGKVISTPFSYRDGRAADFQDQFFEKMNKEEIFLETGTQPDSIISALQLYADLTERPYLKNVIHKILFMPNLFEFFFTGKAENEFTIASTSGLLCNQNGNPSEKMLKELTLNPEWLGSIRKNGSVLASVLPEIKKEVGLTSDIKVVNGAGHDTGAAILALPIEKSQKSQAAFISCGTWSIVGTQTQKPVVTKKAFDAGLTNEGCFDGENRLLKNITGLWVIQELQKEWSYKGEVVSFDKMVQLAREAGPAKSWISVKDPSFGTPDDMEQKIINYLKKTTQYIPQTKGELIRIAYESLALSYAETIDELEQVTGNTINTVYMFGGGIQNKLLVQLAANYTQKRIVTGPIEASVTGNVISQLLTLGIITENDRLDVLTNSFVSDEYVPQKKLENSEILAHIV